MFDEGYIKYQCRWHNQPSVIAADIKELNSWRDRLYKLGLIGQYPNGIGFGNLSIRTASNQPIIISGTQTGGIAKLTPQHYTKVTDFDWHQNWVSCLGLIKASSETLTHAAIYVGQPKAKAVIHIHHQELWRKLLNTVPTTDPHCTYGTPEMAEEIIKLCQQPATQLQKIIIMSGHEEGILAFGRDLDTAGKTLLNCFDSKF